MQATQVTGVIASIPGTATADEMLDAWAEEARSRGLTVRRTGLPLSETVVAGREHICGLAEVPGDGDYVLVIPASDTALDTAQPRTIEARPAVASDFRHFISVSHLDWISLRINSPLSALETAHLEAAFVLWCHRLAPNSQEWPSLHIIPDGSTTELRLTVDQTLLSLGTLTTSARQLLALHFAEPRRFRSYAFFAVDYFAGHGHLPPRRIRIEDPAPVA